jgi:thymidine phosphorylase
VITDMSQPLGRAVGNANEMVESIGLLRGGGPPDLRSLVLRLGEDMLLAGGVAADREEARARLELSITSGEALAKLAETVEAQGGDPAVLHDPGRFPTASGEHVVTARHPGHVQRADALDIAVGALRLGAGRERKEDDIDPAAGILVEVKVGDRVDAGDPLARVAWNDRERLDAALPSIERAFEIGEQPRPPVTLIYEEVR